MGVGSQWGGLQGNAHGGQGGPEERSSHGRRDFRNPPPKPSVRRLPPTPTPGQAKEGFTYRHRLRAGSCWLQERERKASQLGSSWWASGLCRGEVGGWQVGLSNGPGALGLQTLGTGSSLRQGQRRGRRGRRGLPLLLRLLQGLGFAGWQGPAGSGAAADLWPRASFHSFILMPQRLPRPVCARPGRYPWSPWDTTRSC